jgi:predicted dehydrogenase
MSTPSLPRVAVLGVGAISQVAHLPILARMRGVELAAVCDADHLKAEALAKRFGVPRVHRKDEDLWNDEEIDAVVICTPSHLHEEQSITALEAGKFVLCEKPLALTAEGARRVLATEGADSRLAVAMNQRHRPDAAALKAFLEGSELGDVSYVRTGWLNRRVGRTRRVWRYRRETAGGGALMDLGIQMLDLALWLLDYPEPVRVTAHTHGETDREVEDAAVLLLELEGGTVVNLEVTWNLLAERERQFLSLLGSAGSGSLAPLAVFKELESGLVNMTPTLAVGRENVYTAAYRDELQQFVDFVRGERSPPAPVEQATLMRILEGAYQSAAEGREVSF